MTRRPLTALALATALLVPAPLRAEEAAPSASLGTDAVSRLALAHELFTLSRARGDALTVLAAARLAGPVLVIREERFARTTSQGDVSAQASDDGSENEIAAIPPPPEAMAKPLTPPDAPAMFALALDLAGEDEFLTAIIGGAKDAAAGDAAARPTATAQRASLQPGASDLWDVPVPEGGAAIAVLGSGASDLDISVRDGEGNLLCYEAGPEDALLCAPMGPAPAFLQVLVANSGSSETQYDLVTP